MNMLKPKEMDVWVEHVDVDDYTIEILIEHDIRHSYSRDVDPRADKKIQIEAVPAVASFYGSLSPNFETELLKVDRKVLDRESSDPTRCFSRYTYLIHPPVT